MLIESNIKFYAFLDDSKPKLYKYKLNYINCIKSCCKLTILSYFTKRVVFSHVIPSDSIIRIDNNSNIVINDKTWKKCVKNEWKPSCKNQVGNRVKTN